MGKRGGYVGARNSLLHLLYCAILLEENKSFRFITHSYAKHNYLISVTL
jgi:hypothetical protein